MPRPPKAIAKRHLTVTIGIVAVSVAFLIVLAIGLSLDQTKVPPVVIDKPANPFRVAWIKGQEHLPEAPERHLTLADLRGKPVVLNFWASWCVACREEALELEAFWRKHKDEGVIVLGIAIQDEPDAARRFAEQFGKTYALALDEDGKASIDYGVSGVPETFLIDANGVIRHKEIGPVTLDSLEKNLPKIQQPAS